MSEVGKAISYIIKNDSPLTALISGRIYPLIAPQGAANPYISYQHAGVNENSTKDGPSTVDQVRMQFDIVVKNEAVGSGYDTAMSIAGALRTALDRYPHGLVGSTGVTLDGVSYITEDTEYEADANIVVHRIEYYFRHKR